ncbi:TonB-dependent receptor [candidate division KSB1 bacterium]|nr:TonB-dependent receptor [candidate division KSB1 bacterium]RQW03299.1 MAG: TonB-dependent receptor [candidate division KSB1 bacterium]
MKMKGMIRALCIVLVSVLVRVDIAVAGTTGKLSGTVVDKATQEALPGVNIVIEDTQLGAATNTNGDYTILNVPPGIYTLRVSMMGYKEMRIENIRVSIDLTTSQDIELEETVLEAGETVTIVAERPLVQRDMTSSLSSVASSDIEVLPASNIGDVLQLQAGVIRDGNNFHIRGGRANEVTFWVDGVEVTDVYSGQSMGARIENNAVQELQVVSGTFNAEYGKAMAGIINVITKEGGQKYSGKVDMYVGDYVSNNSVFSVLEKVTTQQNPETGELEEVEHLENPLTKFNPTYNVDLSLSGPLPFLGDKITFFANGRYVSREGYLYGRQWFLPQGLPGDSSLTPMTSGYDYSGIGKLTYRVSPNVKLNYQLMASKSHNDRSYSRGYRFVPGAVPQYNGNSYTNMLSLIHTLSKSTFYELRLSTMSTESNSYLYEDPTQMPHFLVRVPADSLNPETIIDPSTTKGSTVLDSIKLADVDYQWFVNPNNAEGYVDPDSSATPTSFSYSRAGTTNSLSFRNYTFWDVKLDVTSQINQQHQIKAGFEAKLHELKRDSYTLIPGKTAGGTEEIIPFTPTVPDISSLSRDKYTQRPRELSAYIQDKIELREMIVNVGLRLDYFDANTTIPTDPRDPDIYNPFRNENIYKDWVEPTTPMSPSELEAYKATFTHYTPEERAVFMRTQVDPKVSVSPRIGISYPITDRGIIHFSYGHFLGMPGFQYLYNNSAYKLQSGGGNSLLGNPDLEPERTVHYEIGLQQQLSNDVGLKTTLFYKDTRDWVGATPLLKTVRPSVAYSKYRNEDYSNVYGLTLELKRRFTQTFSASLDYTYQLAEGTYSNPGDAYDNIYNDSATPDEPRKAMVPMNWDQRHTLNVYLTMQRWGWLVSLIERFQSGQPYTPTVSKSEITGASSYVGWTTNSEYKPTINSLDVRIMKSFDVASTRLLVYTIIYNLFDQKGQRNVYGETGTADFSANLLTDYPGYNPERIGTYNENLRRPEWYQAPREIQLGLAIEF